MTEPDRYARFQRGGRGAASFRDLVPAEFRRVNEEDEPRVVRVRIIEERAGGVLREWDAVEPLDYQVSPGLAMSGPRSAGARMSVSFRANPRWNLRIWTGGRTSFDGIRRGLDVIAEALGCRLVPGPGLRSGLEAAVRAEAEDPGDGNGGHACPHCGRGTGSGAAGGGGVRPDPESGRDAAGDHGGVARAVPAEDWAQGPGSGPASGNDGS